MDFSHAEARAVTQARRHSKFSASVGLNRKQGSEDERLRQSSARSCHPNRSLNRNVHYCNGFLERMHLKEGDEIFAAMKAGVGGGRKE
jgi:hypothetical protein